MGAPLVFFLSLPHFPSEAALRARPDLKGRPFVVATGDGGRRRVLDVSPELRGRGVWKNMLLDRLPPGLRPEIVPVDAHALRRASEELIVHLDRYSPVVASPRAGEYYLDMKGTQSLMGRPLSSAVAILSEVRRVFDSTGRVGIAETKLLAFLAARAAPLQGAFEVWGGCGLAFLHAMPIPWLPGLGAATRLSMRGEYGHQTLGELAAYGEGDLRLLWGEEGALAHRAVTGRLIEDLVPYRFERSVEVEIPLGVHDREASRLALDLALVEAARKLRLEGAFAHRFDLEVAYGDGRSARFEKRLKVPGFHERGLRLEVRPVLDEALTRRIYAVKAVLVLRDLRPPARQLSLMADDGREDRIVRAFDQVRARWGRSVLRLGFEPG